MDKNTWQLIETAPKDGTKILAYGTGIDGWSWSTDKAKTGQVTVCQWTDHEVDEYVPVDNGLYKKVKKKVFGFWRGTSPSWFEPTHWMPLPLPPEQ